VQKTTGSWRSWTTSRESGRNDWRQSTRLHALNDGGVIIKPAREAFMGRFERIVDRNLVLPPEERNVEPKRPRRPSSSTSAARRTWKKEAPESERLTGKLEATQIVFPFQSLTIARQPPVPNRDSISREVTVVEVTGEAV
jgi:hypothetical protein